MLGYRSISVERKLRREKLLFRHLIRLLYIFGLVSKHKTGYFMFKKIISPEAD